MHSTELFRLIIRIYNGNTYRAKHIVGVHNLHVAIVFKIPEFPTKFQNLQRIM